MGTGNPRSRPEVDDELASISATRQRVRPLRPQRKGISGLVVFVMFVVTLGVGAGVALLAFVMLKDGTLPVEGPYGEGARVSYGKPGPAQSRPAQTKPAQRSVAGATSLPASSVAEGANKAPREMPATKEPVDAVEPKEAIPMD